MISKIIDSLKNTVLSIDSKQLEKSVNNSDITREADMKQILELWKSHKKLGFRKLEEFCNVSVFASVVGRDIQFLSKSMVTSTNKNERNLYARILGMTLIEFLSDMNQLLGKKLRNEIKENGYSNYLDELNQINKDMSKLKKDNNSKLREIRNNSVAHKDKDSRKLLSFSEKEISKNIFEIAIETSKLNNRFTEFTTKIVNQYVKDLEHEIAKTNK